MIEQTLRRFCESKYRWLIVIVGTFAAGLVLVLPLVDVYRAGHDKQEALLAELDSARHTAAELEKFESRSAERLAELAAFEARTVNEESLPALRGKLVDLAKEASCNIRRLSVGAVSSRPWRPDEDPTAPAGVAKPNAAPPTRSGAGFVLEWRPVSISLSGTSANLRTLLERIAAAGMLMHTKSLEMYPSGPVRQSLTLDMELWYFALARRG